MTLAEHIAHAREQARIALRRADMERALTWVSCIVGLKILTGETMVTLPPPFAWVARI